jgi:hypothetical protein
MAYAATMEGFGAALPVMQSDSPHGSVAAVPDAALLAGEFRRAGPDLVLTGHDGRHFIITNYFSTEHHAALIAPNGATLSGAVVDLLAISPAQREYAQAQPTPPADAIGKVEKVVGTVTVLRHGVAVALNVGDVVYKSDVLETGAAASVGISFPDGTALDLVANTRMALNEYSFDPNANANGVLFSLVEGTFAFVAGKVAHSGEMKIATPVATMGIRGTTGYVVEVSSGYEFVVVDDYATTRHGAYDLFRIDQNGGLMRDQNGLPILLATVSQTEFVTDCSSTACSTTPMSASQQAFAQQIIPQLFQTYILSNPTTPQSVPGHGGSSTPPPNAPLEQNPQLIQNYDPHSNIATAPSNNDPVTPSAPVNIVVPPPPPPPPPQTGGWASQTLVEYYYYPNPGTVYYTSPTFVVPASGIEGNPDRGGVFSLSVSGESITASHFTFTGVFTEAAFNGFEVIDLSSNPLISGVTIDSSTNMDGLNSSDIVFDSNAIWVNWQGLGFNSNTVVQLDVTFDPPLNPSQVTLVQTLDGAVAPALNTTTLTVADGTALALQGDIDNSGVLAVGGTTAATALGINGIVTLQGGGHVELSESNENYIFGDGTLINVDNTISGGGDIGNGTLSFHNAGVVVAEGPAALIIDTGAHPVVNTGTLETKSGALIIDSPVTGGGDAVIAGGSLEFTGASDNNVSFGGSATGVLALDQSHSFTGQISGFAAPDQIDLGDIAYSSNTTLSYAADADHHGGVLTVSDGAQTTALDFVGSFTATSFALASDGHGGTMLDDVAVTSTNASSSAVAGAAAATPGVDTTGGSVAFTSAAPTDVETASFTPDAAGYAGHFSLGAVSDSNGSGAVAWAFSLDHDQINLAPGATQTQSYDVTVGAPAAVAAQQTIAVSIGGAGNDTFVFQPGLGADTILNFNPQADTIDLNAFHNIQSEQQLLSLITNDAQGDAMIDLGHHDSVSLPGVTAAQLLAVLQSAVHLH